jgi:hypothetical protein
VEVGQSKRQKRVQAIVASWRPLKRAWQVSKLTAAALDAVLSLRGPVKPMGNQEWRTGLASRIPGTR